MVGMLFGGLMIGRICDLFGRRFATFSSLLIGTISHFVAGWATSYAMYVVLRFLTGIGNQIVSIVSLYHNINVSFRLKLLIHYSFR